MSSRADFAKDYATSDLCARARDAGYNAEVSGNTVFVSKHFRKVKKAEVRENILYDPLTPLVKDGRVIKILVY
jgi:hypothetical protein